MITLVKPSKKHFQQLNILKYDFFDNKEFRIQGSGSIDKYYDLDKWLKSINEIEQGKNEKLVPSTYYLILSDEEVVGTISMRHYLTKDLEEFGGHIGYSITPSARRKGYATEEWMNGRTPSFGKAMMHGGFVALEGMVNFGVGDIVGSLGNVGTRGKFLTSKEW